VARGSFSRIAFSTWPIGERVVRWISQKAAQKSAGHAFRLKADLLKAEFGRFGPTMHLLLRYTQALITLMAQTAVCNRHHSVDQQLCRWPRGRRRHTRVGRKVSGVEHLFRWRYRRVQQRAYPTHLFWTEGGRRGNSIGAVTDVHADRN